MAVHFNISFFITIIFVCSASFFINAKNFKRKNQGVSFAIFVKALSVKLNAVKLASLEIPKLECTLQCLRNHECFSVNVGACTAKKQVCELLGTDKFRHSNSLIQDPEFEHYYIKTPCMGNPCQDGASCLPIYDRDEYECVCLPGYTGQHCNVHWEQMTTSPVCFGASADSFGHFVAPIAGDVLTFKLIHQSGSVECLANPLYASHWGCTYPTLPQDHQLGTIITNSQSERLLPKDEYFFLEGIPCNNRYYGLPGQTADLPELLFDNFSTPLHVSVGQEFRIWFGEDLYKCGHADNGLGKTCVLVLGLFV